MAAGRGQTAAVGAESHLLQTTLLVTAGELFLAGLRVPQLHQLATGGGEPPAVGAELHASDYPGKAQRECLLPRVHVPDLHFPFLLCFPTTSGGQALTVRTKGYTPDPAGVFPAKKWLLDVPLKDLLHVPNLHGLIPASAGKIPAVGTEPNGGCILLVSPPLLGFAAGFRLPEADKAVLGGRGQVPSVGAECDAVDAALMTQGGKGAVAQPL